MTIRFFEKILIVTVSTQKYCKMFGYCVSDYQCIYMYLFNIPIQTISLTSGFVLAYATGHFLDWRTASMVLSAVPLLASVSMLLLPETPYWLIEHGKNEKAR